MSLSPADVLMDLLPNTIIGGSTGWVGKVGKLVSTPDQVVAFYDTPGMSPNPKWLVDYPSVQVMVRAGPNKYSGGYTKIRQIRDKLLGFESADVGADRWVSITCMGDAGFLSYDDKERPLFSVNFRIIIEPAPDPLTNREAL